MANEAFDILQTDEQLRAELSKERGDVAAIGAQTSPVIIGALENNQRAIETYKQESAVVNQSADAALAATEAYTARFNQLQNAGFFERIGNAFAGIVDPNRDINAVGTKVQQSWDQVKLAEAGRAQIQDKFATEVKANQTEIDIAGQKLAQQVREMDLVQGELTSRRQQERDKLEQQQTFLATKSVPELQAGVKSGFITQRQLDDELDRQKRNRLSLKSAEMALGVQDVETYNFHRLEALDKTSRPQVELMRKQAKGGIFQNGNIAYRVDELDARLKKFAESDVDFAANNIAEAEATSAGRTAADRLSVLVGLDTSEMKPADAFATMAKRSDVFSPQAATLLRQAAAIQTAMDSTDDARARGQMATAYAKVVNDVQESMQKQIEERYPAKTTASAISQFSQNGGRIDDMMGAQELMIGASSAGIATGSPVYDDILLQMRTASTLAPFGIVGGKQQAAFDTQMATLANKVTTTAYNVGAFTALKSIAADPQFAALGLGTALQNTGSLLYSNGRFSISNLERYVRGSAKDKADSATRFRLLEEAMQKHLPEASRQTFTPVGTNLDGAVAISSINARVFGNKPQQNFIAQMRSKMAQLRQQAALE